MERSVHDALCVVKRVLESQMVVAGGGAVEAALSIFLENLATSIVSMLEFSLPVLQVKMFYLALCGFVHVCVICPSSYLSSLVGERISLWALNPTCLLK